MGITGLLPFVKKATTTSHVRRLSGCTVAIDAYCWLHKGCFGCAQKIGMGEPTEAYITYCMKYIQVLLDHKIKPIVVLDGRNLPSKAHTETERREKRTKYRKLARKYLQEGKKKEAWECFQRCVDITPFMAREFIKRLRSMNIDYVVSPYEADAQLAYMAKTGIADVIITEDSDLILFGCPKIFFKMKAEGDGMLFEQSKLPKSLDIAPRQFDFDRFRWMCMLSGCDYLASLPGIGLARAKKVIYASDATYTNIEEMILSIPSATNLQVEVTDEYIAGFIQAENTFLYQLVFDTATRSVIPLNPYPDGINIKDLKYAGTYEEKKLALGLALGNVDLHTLQTVDNFEPIKSTYPVTSIWHSSFSSASASTSTTLATAMQMSSPVKKTSSSAKKRPLAVTNEKDDTPGDDELMNLYSSITIKDCKVVIEDLNVKVEDCTETETDSSTATANAKRRRVSQTQPTPKTEVLEDNSDSPSRITRSRNRSLPFIKSPPESSKVHVKSKYFRSESEVAVTEELITKRMKLEIKKEAEIEVEPEQHHSESASVQSSLSIYSYSSSSQGSNFTDASAGSQSSYHSAVSSQSQNSQKEDVVKDELEFETNGTDDLCSTSDEKTGFSDSVAVITLDDEKDEAYESMGMNGFVKSSQASSVSSLSSYSASSPYFANSLKPTPTKSIRRQGLSRTGKKVDPKQRSVKDMFVRQVSKS